MKKNLPGRGLTKVEKHWCRRQGMLFKAAPGSPDIIWYATATLPLVTMCWGCCTKLRIFVGGFMGWEFFFERKGPGRSLVTGPKVGWGD